MWGCIGAILAAVITGYCSLVAAGKLRVPWETTSEHSERASSAYDLSSQRPSPSPKDSTRLPEPDTSDAVPYVAIKEFIPFQRKGQVSPDFQKTMSQKYDGKRVRVAGYLIFTYPKGSLVNFGIAPDVKGAD